MSRSLKFITLSDVKCKRNLNGRLYNTEVEIDLELGQLKGVIISTDSCSLVIISLFIIGWRISVILSRHLSGLSPKYQF